MTVKQKTKIIIDLAMTVMLPLLMAYNMVGDAAHEWIGVAIFVLFILHHILNFRFTAAVSKGKYTPARILLTVTEVFLFLDMLCMMISSVLLSRHAFSFLGINIGASAARTMHLLGAYWGFVIMSLHIGMHAGAIIGAIKQAAHISEAPKGAVAAFRILIGIVSAYGIYAFITRGLGDYMLLKSQFVFFYSGEPLILFLSDYLTIMVLFSVIGYVLIKFSASALQSRRKKQ